MRTVNVSLDDYRELVESRDWCRRHGFEGMREWYDDHLAYLAFRGALPPGAIEYREEAEAPVGRRG